RRGEIARRGEGDVAVAKEDMIVLDANRPVRCEADFEADANRAAPAGAVRAVELDAGRNVDAAELIADHGAAALHVEQDVAPGVADLTGDQTEGIDLGTVTGADQTEDRAGVVAGEVGPVALALDAEHPSGRLPAIADLTTDG